MSNPRRRVLLVVASLILGAVMIAPVSAQGTFPGANGRIAFDSRRGSPLNLYTMLPDGTDVQQLTHFVHREALLPAWSPDGRQLAFEEHTLITGVRRIVLINADGTGRHRAFADEFFLDRAPSFSPDGSMIVF